MQTVRSELVRLSKPDALKSLLSSRGPCVSIYFPLNRQSLNPDINAKLWKETVKRLHGELQRVGAEGRALLEHLPDWRAIGEGSEPGHSLAIFCSPDYLHRLQIRSELPPKEVVAHQFYIRPLLPLLHTAEFFVLALSQKDVRLLRCTFYSSEAKPLANAQTNFDEFMNLAQPDHVRENRISAGPSAGASKGVTFGTSTDLAEDKGKYLAHFYRQIDRGLNATLRETGERVVLAGVEYELSLYRSISSYPHLVPDGIHGAPNSLKGGELHARAIEVLQQAYRNEVDNFVTEYNHLVGSGGRATNRLKEIVTAAHDGRVNRLLISDSMEQTGVMDETTYNVKGSEQRDGKHYDLLNDAAVQTFLHAGQVLSAPNNKMPNGSPIAAIFRY